MGAGRGKGRGWGRSDDDMLKACAGCCCGSIFIASAIMIACSFSVLSPLEAGISFNTVSKCVGARLRTRGVPAHPHPSRQPRNPTPRTLYHNSIAIGPVGARWGATGWGGAHLIGQDRR